MLGFSLRTWRGGGMADFALVVLAYVLEKKNKHCWIYIYIFFFWALRTGLRLPDCLTEDVASYFQSYDIWK